MAETLSRASKKLGMPPGTLVHVGELKSFASRISVISYSKHNFEELHDATIEDVLRAREAGTVTWVNIEGLHNLSHLDAIGKRFNIHPLVLEDLANTHQRTKLEEFDEFLFLVLKRLQMGAETQVIIEEQVSTLILDSFVFTFREVSDELFEPLLQRLRENKGRLRSLGSDYLAYTILDILVDEYFQLQDDLDDVAEILEDELLDNPTPATLATIQKIKREMIYIRKSISPLREVLAGLMRSDTAIIDAKTKLYIRDVYDHSIRVIESIESYRDLISGMLDIYLSSVSNKLNETMKVLTIFATIFIPLTFITGIYGMNFDFMPELRWYWGYPLVWATFLLVGGGLMYYFKRKKWL